MIAVADHRLLWQWIQDDEIARSKECFQLSVSNRQEQDILWKHHSNNIKFLNNVKSRMFGKEIYNLKNKTEFNLNKIINFKTVKGNPLW